MLLFEMHEFWIVDFPQDYFKTDPSLLTFLDQSPKLSKKSLNTENLQVETIYHAQCYHPPEDKSLTVILLAFLKANGVIFLVQNCLPEGDKMVKHEVPPAIAINGQEGDITAVRFWLVKLKTCYLDNFTLERPAI